MNKGFLTTLSVFALGILAVIAGFFLLDIEKIAVNFWAFGSLLFSLIVCLTATLAIVSPEINKNSLFLKSGLGSAVFVYEIAVIISLFFVKSYVNRLNSFIFTQIGINALFFISAIIFFNVAARIQSNNEKILENQQNGEYETPKRGGF